MTLVKRGSPRETLDNRATPRDQKGLLVQLDDTRPDVRRWGALDLAAYPEAVEALCARLGREPVAYVREAILTTLITLKGARTVEGLLPLLGSDDAALRNGVIEALQQLSDDVSAHMARLLEHADSDVRISAINVLETLRHPDAPRWLFQVVRRDPHVNVCAAAVDLLAELGSPEMVCVLRELPQRFPTYPFIRFAVYLTVRRILGEG